MRVAAFETVKASNQQILPVKKNSKLRQVGTVPNKITEKRFTKSNDYVKCFICDEGHQINHCDEFLSMTIEDLKAAVFKFKLCYNCFRRNHQVRQVGNPHVPNVERNITFCYIKSSKITLPVSRQFLVKYTNQKVLSLHLLELQTLVCLYNCILW